MTEGKMIKEQTDEYADNDCNYCWNLYSAFLYRDSDRRICARASRRSQAGSDRCECSGDFRVAVDDGFCPMSFYDADGNLSGLNVELITMVANQLGMRLEFECGDWMTCRQNLEEESRCNSRSGDIFKYAACIKDSSGDNRPA